MEPVAEAAASRMVSAGWDVIFPPNELQDDTEDISDESYVKRHIDLEMEERKKFLQYFTMGLRRRNNSTPADTSPSPAPPVDRESSASPVPTTPARTTSQISDDSETPAKRPRVHLTEADLSTMYQKLGRWLPNPVSVASYPPRSFPLSDREYKLLTAEDEANLKQPTRFFLARIIDDSDLPPRPSSALKNSLSARSSTDSPVEHVQ